MSHQQVTTAPRMEVKTSSQLFTCTKHTDTSLKRRRNGEAAECVLDHTCSRHPQDPGRTSIFNDTNSPQALASGISDTSSELKQFTQEGRQRTVPIAGTEREERDHSTTDKEHCAEVSDKGCNADGMEAPPLTAPGDEPWPRDTSSLSS